MERKRVFLADLQQLDPADLGTLAAHPGHIVVKVKQNVMLDPPLQELSPTAYVVDPANISDDDLDVLRNLSDVGKLIRVKTPDADAPPSKTDELHAQNSIATARLQRETSDDQGTYGTLLCNVRGNQRVFHTLELPWRGNERNVSCIPAGRYMCSYEYTNKVIGDVRNWYLAHDVPGRSGILFHPGNWAGDRAKGFHSDVRGCILVGKGKVLLDSPTTDKQMAVTDTRTACKELAQFFATQPFELEVVDA